MLRDSGHSVVFGPEAVAIHLRPIFFLPRFSVRAFGRSIHRYLILNFFVVGPWEDLLGE